MQRKLILLDLDGTIIDHTINDVPKSTKEAISILQAKGHCVVIATGRTPSLFYGIDKMLKIDTFIAANGRYVQYKDKVLFHDIIDPKVIKRFVEDMESRNIDVAFETKDDYVVNQKTSNLPDQFSDYFHLKYPPVIKDYYKHNDILQMVMFYTGEDYEDIKNKYPELSFNFSCSYGIDINAKGGLKEIGMQILMSYLNIGIEDTIAVGDGYNDIGMVKNARIGIAMGNACDELKSAADYITDTCSNDGLFKAFREMGLI